MSRLREQRELTITADRWRDALTFGERDLQALLARVPSAKLDSAHKRYPPDMSVDVYVSDDCATLWIGCDELAKVPR